MDDGSEVGRLNNKLAAVTGAVMVIDGGWSIR
jgi:hypothetical protein